MIGISVIGDMWIPTTSSAVPQTARLITSNTPFDYVDGSEWVSWSIDPAGIATIDRAGKVMPLAIGSAVVTAHYGDKTGINNIRVLPDYSGAWSGEFVVTGCSGGIDPRECGRIMNGVLGGNGPLHYPFTLDLSQFRDQLTGTLRETRASGDVVIPVTGFVRQNGFLILEAATPYLDRTLQVLNWSSTANAAVAAMSGAFTQIEPRNGPFGEPYSIRTEQEFTNISRAR